MLNPIFLLSMGLVLALTLCIEDVVKIKFNPEYDPFAFVVADISKAYPSVPRPELVDGCVKTSQVFHPNFSDIIRGIHGTCQISCAEQ